MNSFANLYYEKRRNPEKNPKITFQDYYLKYYADKDIYISFRDKNTADKVGINPKSKFSTPNGYYTYPLNAYVSKYEFPKNVSEINFPFASEKPVIHILRNNHHYTHIEDIGKIKYAEAEKYVNLLLEYFINYFKSIGLNNITEELLIEHVVSYAAKNATNESIGGELWNVTRVFAIIKKEINLYYENFLDNQEDYEAEEDLIAVLKVLRKGSYNSIFKSSNVWTWLWLNVLGVGSVSDLGGRIIHSNEPIQTIFFTPRQLALLHVVDNKPPAFE